VENSVVSAECGVVENGVSGVVVVALVVVCSVVPLSSVVTSVEVVLGGVVNSVVVVTVDVVSSGVVGCSVVVVAEVRLLHCPADIKEISS